MKKNFVFLTCILFVFCAGLFNIAILKNSEARAQTSFLDPSESGTSSEITSSSSFSVVRNEGKDTSSKAEKGAKEVTFEEIKLTNYASEAVDVYVPVFYATADIPFKLEENLDNAYLLVNGKYIANITHYGMVDSAYGGGKNELIFNFPEFTPLKIPANSSILLTLKGDISSSAKVSSLSFDLDFSNTNFIIKYTSTDSLTPFDLSGGNSIVCIGDDSVCPILNVSTTNINYTKSGEALYAPNIKEGGMIRAKGDIDIYIVKYAGNKRFKRLILSPSVFRSYGHLKWSDVNDVDVAVLNSYSTSYYVRVADENKIWRLDPDGDSGLKREFRGYSNTSWNFDADGVYEINSVDKNSYLTGSIIEF